MSRHAAQYVRPDVCAIGGITTAKKVAAIAEAHDVLVIPHNPLGPVSTAASSPPFSTDVRSVLHEILLSLQPGHG